MIKSIKVTVAYDDGTEGIFQLPADVSKPPLAPVKGIDDLGTLDDVAQDSDVTNF